MRKLICVCLIAPIILSGCLTNAKWLALRVCESGNNYSLNSGNGYYGAYQFNQSTWDGVAAPGYRGVRPSNTPPLIQDYAAIELYKRSGTKPWPNCGRFLV